MSDFNEKIILSDETLLNLQKELLAENIKLAILDTKSKKKQLKEALAENKQEKEKPAVEEF